MKNGRFEQSSCAPGYHRQCRGRIQHEGESLPFYEGCYSKETRARHESSVLMRQKSGTMREDEWQILGQGDHLQVGKVVRIGKQPISFSVEAGRVATRPAGTPNPGWIFGFEMTPIFNFHLGPGKKIDLRGKKEQ